MRVHRQMVVNYSFTIQMKRQRTFEEVKLLV
jgi:hypothetical protein